MRRVRQLSHSLSPANVMVERDYLMSTLAMYGILDILRNVSSFRGKGDMLGAQGPRPTWYRQTTFGGAILAGHLWTNK